MIEFSPDIYIIGLQEIVKLNAKSVLFKDTKRVNAWEELIKQTLLIINEKNVIF